MSLINLIFLLVVIGVLLWAINTYLPMDAKMKKILNICVTIGVVLFLLQLFGVLAPLDRIHVGRR
jgi:hypothetical protein